MPAVTSPALDVCLAHEIGFQFGHHNADDSDKDEEIHLQGRWVSGWKPSRDARSSLVLLPAPPQARQNSPSPTSLPFALLSNSLLSDFVFILISLYFRSISQPLCPGFKL